MKKRTAYAHQVGSGAELLASSASCRLSAKQQTEKIADGDEGTIFIQLMKEVFTAVVGTPAALNALQVKEKGPVEHPLWTLRTKEEAEEFWEDEFGHLKRDNSASAANQQKQQKAQEHRPRSFVASGESRFPAVTLAAAAMACAAPKPDQARLRPSVPAQNIGRPEQTATS